MLLALCAAALMGGTWALYAYAFYPLEPRISTPSAHSSFISLHPSRSRLSLFMSTQSTLPMTTVSDTPYTAIRAVRTAGTPLAQLSAMLAAARRYGGPGAARAAADKAAVPTAVTGALRTPSGSYVPLVWLRPDQAYGAPYALERKCAVLPEGATGLPDGWSVAL